MPRESTADSKSGIVPFPDGYPTADGDSFPGTIPTADPGSVAGLAASEGDVDSGNWDILRLCTPSPLSARLKSNGTGRKSSARLRDAVFKRYHSEGRGQKEWWSFHLSPGVAVHPA
jgi:hypothetical protein